MGDWGQRAEGRRDAGIEICQAALGETHSQAALGNDGGVFFFGVHICYRGGDSGYFHSAGANLQCRRVEGAE